MTTPARRLTPLVIALAGLTAAAAAIPILLGLEGAPTQHISVRGEAVTLFGSGPYRHMPADVAIQGFAQDIVTLIAGVPALIAALIWARTGARAGHLALTGVVAYLFVQYFLYLGMATYNELFLLWVLILMLSSQALVRLMLAGPAEAFETALVPDWQRKAVGGFLIVNGVLIGSLWLSVIVPPLISGSLYPAGLAHFTTLVVQGFDLALFLPASLIAGYRYLARKPGGGLLASVYSVFLVLQMTALIAKIIWMIVAGAPAGPALVIIPVLLLGAALAAYGCLRANAGYKLP